MNEELEKYFTIEELIQNFTLAELVTLTEDKSLQNWLESRFYNEQAILLNADHIAKYNDDELRLAICEVLEIDPLTLSDYDSRAIDRALEKRRKKSIYADNESDNEIIAETQQDLIKILADNKSDKIYLCGGEFQISLNKENITYIGRDNAVVNITSKQPINFDEKNIHLKNLKIFLQNINSDQITANDSSNLIFLNGNSIAINPKITQNDIYNLLQGRNKFESFDEFAERAENLSGVVIGEALLNENDFDIHNNIFEIKPRWRMNFSKLIKKFAENKFFSSIIAPNIAKSIYENQRKILIYADFATDGDEAIIKNIFLQIENQIEIFDGNSAVIKNIFPQSENRIEIFATDKPLAEVLAGLAISGSSGGRGYGINLINLVS
ncbi:MAG: hypothetical protein IJ728_04810 [Selenomonadaceae bacterium]|nr:hypothetical protein [Selenomonadaceae bacterium]